MTTRLPNLLKLCGALACCSIFIAASCESKKPVVAPATTNGPATASQNTTTGATSTTGTTGKLEPDDVGPRAPAIFMLSGLKGYTEPCGCTLDVMLGGIDRIAGYIAAARPLYESVYVVDGGDLFFETTTLEEHEIPQERAKIAVVSKGLAEIGVQITVPGERDFALGIDTYFEQLKAAGITPVAANMTISGRELIKTQRDGNRLFVGIADPALYKDIKGVKVSDPKKALAALQAEIDAADITVLIAHGEVPFAKEMLEAVPGADFALVGHKPRETDQVDQIGHGFTLEPYDQGRYLGVLKLFNAEGAAGKPFVDARPTSKAELEKVERQIEHVNESINKLPPATVGNEPPVLLSLRARLAKLQARREEIQRAALNVPAEGPSFLWRSIALEPGLPVHEEIERIRDAYNAQLKQLNSGIEREVVPVAKGAAEFIGTDNCSSCHSGAKAFWDKTAHARAWPTLVDRNKDFDQKCVGCHVVGYDQPGGSVIGKFEYDVTLDVMGTPSELHKSLTNVGCESCHGPGSLHVKSPVNSDGAPQHIIVDPTVEQCSQCHVPEHSPRFRFDVYVDEITGPGHRRTP